MSLYPSFKSCLAAVIAGGLALTALPAFAAQPATAAGNQKYCADFAMTGSRVPKRICLTAKEWKNRYDVDVTTMKVRKEASSREKAVGSPS